MSTRFRALEPFVRAARRDAAAQARCELCAAPIREVHTHVYESARQAIHCACPACAVLFRNPGAGGGRYRTVPERVIADEEFALSEVAWAALGIPVRLAYLVRRDDGWTAFLPSPGGPVEAPLSSEAKETLASATPLVAEAEVEVEALLIERKRSGAARCFLVPIDVCHELAAVVRRSWRGFSGGAEADRALEEFFTRLAGRAHKRSKRRPR